jgi:hypothetical protein
MASRDPKERADKGASVGAIGPNDCPPRRTGTDSRAAIMSAREPIRTTLNA